MRQLMDELAAEKRGRAEERLARQKKLIMPAPKELADDMTVSEDLGAEADQRLTKWRKSIDTDEESVEDGSLFSRSRSPTIAPSVFDGSVSGHEGHPQILSQQQQQQQQQQGQQPPPLPPKIVAIGPPRPRQTPQQMTMFQKVLKGIAGEAGKTEDDEVIMGPGGRRGCTNCKGQDAGMAWNTVSLLRDENKALKHRVAQLETSVESALDVVNGIGM